MQRHAPGPRSRARAIAWAVGLLLPVGCDASRTTPIPSGTDTSVGVPVAAPAGDHPDDVSFAAFAADPGSAIADTAGLLIRVKWPQRWTQVIPGVTQTLVVTVSGAQGLIRTATLTRAQTTARLDRLPAETVSIRVEALDGTGAVLASGEQALSLSPNTLAALTLKLAVSPAFQPAITGVSPQAAAPGSTVYLSGRNLPTGAASFSLAIGGATVPADQLHPISAGLLSFEVPVQATTSAIVLTVDGAATASPQVFVSARSLLVAPAAPSPVAPGATLSFAAKVADAAGSPVGEIPVRWSLTNVTGVNVTIANPGGFLGTLSPLEGQSDATGDIACTFTATATGSGWVTATSGSLVATAAISVE